MVKVIWTEIDEQGRDVEKVKELESIDKAQEFVGKLSKKDNFIEVLSIRALKPKDDW